MESSAPPSVCDLLFRGVRLIMLLAVFAKLALDSLLPAFGAPAAAAAAAALPGGLCMACLADRTSAADVLLLLL